MAAADLHAAARATEPDNAPRWDGRRPGHYEVWYLTFNHGPSSTGFWIRYTLEAPASGGEAPYGQLWFAAFDRQRPAAGFALNRRFPLDALFLHAQPFAVNVAGSELRHDGARGSLDGGGHSARWDLHWDPSPWTHRHLPGAVYETPFADTRVLSPNPDIAVRGFVEADGRRFELAAEPGGQSHLWGRKHAHAWGWGRCSAFDGGAEALLEALTVRIRRGPLVSPPLTFLTLYLDGAALRFTGFRSALRARGATGTGRYAFSAAGGDVRIEGEFTCAPESMVQATYTDPDGQRCYCANTEVGDLRLSIRRRVAGAAWEERHLSAHGTAHFEVGSRRPDPLVTRTHLAV